MECMPNELSHADDHYLGCCLHKRLGIVAWDTRDAMGGERFHIFPPPICAEYRLPEDVPKAVAEDYYFAYAYDPPRFVPQAGAAHCSPDTVAFHHLPSGEFKPTHDLYYRCKDWEGFKDVPQLK